MKKYALKTSLLVFIVQILIIAGAFVLYRHLNKDEYLILFLSALVLIEILTVLALYFLIIRRNNDIEMSKRKFMDANAYLIKIKANGKIKAFNNTCQSEIKNINNFKSIHDFLIEGDNGFTPDIQEPFIASFEGKKGKLKLRFLPLRTTGGYLLVGEDVTDQAEVAEYYRKLAMDNLVTGLPNKNFLKKRLENLFLDKELLNKKNSLVEINIQDFKRINRLFGVKFGDECLVKMADVLRRALKGFQHEIFHLHADDFMVLFLNLESYEQVTEWTDRLLKYLKKALPIAGTLLILEVKIGIFHMETDIYPNLNYASAIENVALALKKAKGSRISDYIVYDMGLGQHFTRLQSMENDLLHALEKNELVMYYQPQVYNNRRRVYGFEALIRWNNPKYFHESPIHFIRLAEENNLIVDLGRFVIDETFRFAKEVEPFNIRVSINVSPVQILHAGFVNEIETAFRKYKLRENSICIEITETFLLDSFDLIVDKLVNLKRLGISIRLDNFGSEYSSLSYLKALPIDGISIGQEFIRDLNTDATVRTIVSQIIALGESLRLEVIAEGVENERQNRFLMENGCRIVQGYLLSKPLPKQDAMKFITDYDNKFPILDDLR